MLHNIKTIQNTLPTISPLSFKPFFPDPDTFSTNKEREEHHRRINQTIFSCYLKHPNPFDLRPSSIYLSSIFSVLNNPERN